jgi:hypothetical protein
LDLSGKGNRSLFGINASLLAAVAECGSVFSAIGAVAAPAFAAFVRFVADVAARPALSGLIRILFCELLVFLSLLLLKLLSLFLCCANSFSCCFGYFWACFGSPVFGALALGRWKLVGMHRGSVTRVVVPGLRIVSPRTAGTPMNRTSLAGGNDSALAERRTLGTGSDWRLAMIYGSSQLWIGAGSLEVLPLSGYARKMPGVYGGLFREC